jgi:magnesium chelatase family protein
MSTRVHASCLVGLTAHPVEVEVHLGGGLPSLDLVGLPEAALRESRVRVRAALAAVGFALPPKHVILNLAPADLKKRGAGFDLPIAVALLAASGACAPNLLDTTLFVGELSLSGELRGVRGVLPLLEGARRIGLTRAVVPAACEREASWVPSLDVRIARTLAEVVDMLAGVADLPRARGDGETSHDPIVDAPDLADVHGQPGARRALEIAAAGAHALLLVGPPGAGKTMLARRLPAILPPPTPTERIEIASIASAAGLPITGLRPFRAPHHTASTAAIVGGGDPVRPGEVTLAHGGVLFLDELPELARASIEALRTTMELGVAAVARVNERVVMPARPLLIAAMNPCPCGYAGDRTRECTCPASRIDSYRARISGPIVDRFDMHVMLPKVAVASLARGPGGEASAVVRARVERARARALAAGTMTEGGRHAGIALDRALGELTREGRSLIERAGDRLGLSLRGLGRALAVARTIAHLDAAARVDTAHVAEALGYRLLDRPASGGPTEDPRAQGGRADGKKSESEKEEVKTCR